MKKHEKVKFGITLKRLRIERQLSIEEVASHFGKSPQYISDLEKDLYPDEPIGIYFFIAELYGLQFQELPVEVEKDNKEVLKKIKAKLGLRKKQRAFRQKKKRNMIKKAVNSMKTKTERRQFRMK